MGLVDSHVLPLNENRNESRLRRTGALVAVVPEFVSWVVMLGTSGLSLVLP